MKREYYKSYMGSAEWRRKREQRLRKDKYLCQTCGTKHSLEVHHRTYARVGRERVGDLLTLCHTCHHAITMSINARGIDMGWPDRIYDGLLVMIIDKAGPISNPVLRGTILIILTVVACAILTFVVAAMR